MSSTVACTQCGALTADQCRCAVMFTRPVTQVRMDDLEQWQRLVEKIKELEERHAKLVASARSVVATGSKVKFKTLREMQAFYASLAGLSKALEAEVGDE